MPTNCKQPTQLPQRPPVHALTGILCASLRYYLAVKRTVGRSVGVALASALARRRVIVRSTTPHMHNSHARVDASTGPGWFGAALVLAARTRE